MSDEPIGTCVLCGGQISDVLRAGHWSERDGGEGYWYSGHCNPCDIDYRLCCRLGEFGPWEPESCNANELTAIVGEDELLALTENLNRDAKRGPHWNEFLARRREGDVVWRFCTADRILRGFAVVRQGRPISQFC